MTRFLSQALGAREPRFGQSIELLEQASGRLGTDIRLTTAVMSRAREKIADLGLDPKDTTGPELYSALHQRLLADELTVRRKLGLGANDDSDEIVSAVVQFINSYKMPKKCFGLKFSVAKKMLRKRPPKVAMKHLGYRSLDSMLKNEPVVQILAAAFATESAYWQKAFRDQYVTLQPADFEQRDIILLHPSSERWHKLAADFVGKSRHNILALKELGAVVALPISQRIDGLALVTILITLNYLNDIRTCSSYLKLQQVKPDFGQVVRHAATTELFTSASLAGQPVSWRTIQRFYSRFSEAYKPELFEPHVQPEDMQWQHAEDVLAELDPSLSFWQNTQCAVTLHDGQPVSLNVIDVALSFCNHLPYASRIVHFVRDHMWQELMLRYLNQANLELAVAQQLSMDMMEQS